MNWAIFGKFMFICLIIFVVWLIGYWIYYKVKDAMKANDELKHEIYYVKKSLVDIRTLVDILNSRIAHLESEYEDFEQGKDED